VGDCGITDGADVDLIIDEKMIEIAKENKKVEAEETKALEIELIAVFTDGNKVLVSVKENETIGSLLQR